MSKNHDPLTRPSRWRRRLRRLAIGAAVVALLLAVGVGGVIYQHDYDIREEQVEITNGSQTLDGVLAKPPGGGPYGLVIFVHGDGPADATYDGYYRPYWESFARAGYASLSLSKPGVSGSEGDWLDQSMDDRAAEVAAAIAWAKSRPDIDTGRIGLWGTGQAAG